MELGNSREKRAAYFLVHVTPWTVARQTSLPMGTLQARILEWVVMPSSRGSSQPRDQNGIPYVSCIGKQVLYH